MRSKLIIINGLNYIINFILDNLKDFFIYLKNSNILNIGFGMVLGTQITLFVSAVLDYIFKPIIDRFIILFNKKFDEITYCIFDIQIQLGKFLLVLIKFLMTLYLVYIISKLSKTLKFEEIELFLVNIKQRLS